MDLCSGTLRGEVQQNGTASDRERREQQSPRQPGRHAETFVLRHSDSRNGIAFTAEPSSSRQQQLLSAAVMQDTLKMFPMQPDFITSVEGPMVEVRKVSDAAVDVKVTHSFRAHFDSHQHQHQHQQQQGQQQQGYEQQQQWGAKSSQAFQGGPSNEQAHEISLQLQRSPSYDAWQPPLDPRLDNTISAHVDHPSRTQLPEQPASIPAAAHASSSAPDLRLSLASPFAALRHEPWGSSPSLGGGTAHDPRQPLDAGTHTPDAAGAPAAQDPALALAHAADQQPQLALVAAGGAAPPPGAALILGPPIHSEWEIDPSQIQLGRRIAVGGFAEVFVGRYQGTLVAVKRLFANEPDTISRFIQEVRTLARLRHPNLLLWMGYTLRPEPCIVTELMARGSLFHLIKSRRAAAVDPRLVQAAAVAVARGMCYLHTRSPPILHLDLKSPNILVDDKGRIKIADFGLSMVRRHAYVSSGNGGGTPEWMAPEVLRCERYDERADVYSYGVVLWELLTGRAPWDDMNSMQVVGAVGFAHRCLPPPTEGNPFLIQLCTACLSPSPGARPMFPHIVEMLDREFGDLAMWGGEPAQAVEPRRLPPPVNLLALPAPGMSGNTNTNTNTNTGHEGPAERQGEAAQRPDGSQQQGGAEQDRMDVDGACLALVVEPEVDLGRRAVGGAGSPPHAAAAAAAGGASDSPASRRRERSPCSRLSSDDPPSIVARRADGGKAPSPHLRLALDPAASDGGGGGGGGGGSPHSPWSRSSSLSGTPVGLPSAAGVQSLPSKLRHHRRTVSGSNLICQSSAGRAAGPLPALPPVLDSCPLPACVSVNSPTADMGKPQSPPPTSAPCEQLTAREGTQPGSLAMLMSMRPAGDAPVTGAGGAAPGVHEAAQGWCLPALRSKALPRRCSRFGPEGEGEGDGEELAEAALQFAEAEGEPPAPAGRRRQRSTGDENSWSGVPLGSSGPGSAGSVDVPSGAGRPSLHHQGLFRPDWGAAEGEPCSFSHWQQQQQQTGLSAASVAAAAGSWADVHGSGSGGGGSRGSFGDPRQLQFLPHAPEQQQLGGGEAGSCGDAAHGASGHVVSQPWAMPCISQQAAPRVRGGGGGGGGGDSDGDGPASFSTWQQQGSLYQRRQGRAAPLSPLASQELQQQQQQRDAEVMEEDSPTHFPDLSLSLDPDLAAHWAAMEAAACCCHGAAAAEPGSCRSACTAPPGQHWHVPGCPGDPDMMDTGLPPASPFASNCAQARFLAGPLAASGVSSSSSVPGCGVLAGGLHPAEGEAFAASISSRGGFPQLPPTPHGVWGQGAAQDGGGGGWGSVSGYGPAGLTPHREPAQGTVGMECGCAGSWSVGAAEEAAGKTPPWPMSPDTAAITSSLTPEVVQLLSMATGSTNYRSGRFKVTDFSLPRKPSCGAIAAAATAAAARGPRSVSEAGAAAGPEAAAEHGAGAVPGGAGAAGLVRSRSTTTMYRKGRFFISSTSAGQLPADGAGPEQPLALAEEEADAAGRHHHGASMRVQSSPIGLSSMLEAPEPAGPAAQPEPRGKALTPAHSGLPPLPPGTSPKLRPPKAKPPCAPRQQQERHYHTGRFDVCEVQGAAAQEDAGHAAAPEPPTRPAPQEQYGSAALSPGRHCQPLDLDDVSQQGGPLGSISAAAGAAATTSPTGTVGGAGSGVAGGLGGALPSPGTRVGRFLIVDVPAEVSPTGGEVGGAGSGRSGTAPSPGGPQAPGPSPAAGTLGSAVRGGGGGGDPQLPLPGPALAPTSVSGPGAGGAGATSPPAAAGPPQGPSPGDMPRPSPSPSPSPGDMTGPQQGPSPGNMPRVQSRGRFKVWEE